MDQVMPEGVHQLAVPVAPEHVGQRHGHRRARLDRLIERGIGVGVTYMWIVTGDPPFGPEAPKLRKLLGEEEDGIADLQGGMADLLYAVRTGHVHTGHYSPAPNAFL